MFLEGGGDVACEYSVCVYRSIATREQPTAREEIDGDWNKFSWPSLEPAIDLFRELVSKIIISAGSVGWKSKM